MLPSLSLSSSSSSSSATSRVDKATSELLVGPDWTMNMDICDFCNSNHWLAKDVVKEVKRRLQHKNPKVQLLTLTLLETMVKNCGEYIHYHIAERKILDEMIKIVKKKADVHVREKILALLDSWQEAFGGPGGKYSQYFWACDELRRSGVNFPQRSPRSAPVITPPATRSPRVAQVGYGMPANSSRRLDEAMSSEVESLSALTLESMRNALELLEDMLQAVNPSDRMSVKDEVIVDLADRCRANQKKLMQMITTTTRDEDLLAQGLEMNDSLQSVLARHDAIASGSPLPNHKKDTNIQQNESVDPNAKAIEVGDKTPAENGKSPVSDTPGSKAPIEEDEEEDDEFALLARRHSKTQSAPSHGAGMSSNEDATSSSGSNNALVLFDAPAPTTQTSNTKEQDLIDLLSIVLTTSPTNSETPPAPNSAPAQNTFETSLNSYVVPWAQSQPQPQQMAQSMMPQLQPQYQSMQPQMPTQSSQGYSQYSSGYPPPPWDTTSGYGNNHMQGSNPYLYSNSQGAPNNSSISMQGAWSSQNNYTQYGNQQMYPTHQAPNGSFPMQGARTLQHSNSFQNQPSINGNPYSTSQAINSSPSLPMQGVRSLQQVNSFPAKVGSGSVAMNGNISVLNNGSTGIPSSGPQKPYIPSYRLFEDLNVLGGSESKIKNGPYSSASGTRI
ncbi:TOM1-like protein 6 [Bienertia sinuspersici]